VGLARQTVAVAHVPVTRYADTSGGRIAYQVIGDGPIDLLVFPPLLFPIDHMWDEPTLVQFLDRLSSFSRHIWRFPFPVIPFDDQRCGVGCR
jgi:hypothetical protein